MPAEMAAMCNRVREPFNTNTLAQAGAAAALDDDKFLEKTRDLIHTELEYLQQNVEKMGIKPFPSQSNFFLIDVEMDADKVFEAMLKKGVIVRSMVSYGYPEYIRVTVGTRAENDRFLNALEKVMK